MKLEIGMCVRFNSMINKIIEKESNYIIFDDNWYDNWGEEVSSMDINTFIKNYKPLASFNIIDLIKEGDYVNGKEVYSIGLAKAIYNIINFKDGTFIINYDEVKSIVTKEQFEKLKYKVGD